MRRGDGILDSQSLLMIGRWISGVVPFDNSREEGVYGPRG